MKLVVGLGNPGEKYKNTRHNVGFILLDEFVSKEGLSWKSNSKAHAKVSRYEDYLLVKPQTYMNKSGITVDYLMNYYDIQIDDLLVVHDELDFSFLKTKLQKGAGPAGHQGVVDVVVTLKSKDFWRFRVGIGRPESMEITPEEWVLSRFSPKELEEIKNISLPIGGY